MQVAFASPSIIAVQPNSSLEIQNNYEPQMSSVSPFAISSINIQE